MLGILIFLDFDITIFLSLDFLNLCDIINYMRLLSIMSKNGQITIPKKLRVELDLTEGAIIRFARVSSNRMILKEIIEIKNDRKRS